MTPLDTLEQTALNSLVASFTLERTTFPRFASAQQQLFQSRVTEQAAEILGKPSAFLANDGGSSQ